MHSLLHHSVTAGGGGGFGGGGRGGEGGGRGGIGGGEGGCLRSHRLVSSEDEVPGKVMAMSALPGYSDESMEQARIWWPVSVTVKLSPAERKTLCRAWRAAGRHRSRRPGGMRPRSPDWGMRGHTPGRQRRRQSARPAPAPASAVAVGGVVALPLAPRPHGGRVVAVTVGLGAGMIEAEVMSQFVHTRRWKCVFDQGKAGAGAVRCSGRPSATDVGEA
eukprot:scaffold28704_cov101-Isochrysis_galbana.AAC.5